MISTVVVPLDGSAEAERALEPAVQLATRFGADLVLFHPAAEDDEQDVTIYLDGLQARARAHVASGRVEAVVHRGFACQAVIDLVRTRTDAVVCMDPALSGGAGEVVGPVAEDVLADARAPVLLMGPGYSGAKLVDGPRDLLVCLDGSAGASAVEPVAAEWAAVLDLTVRLVTVVDAAEPSRAGLPSDRVVREVAHVAFRLERRGLAVTTEVLGAAFDPAFAVTRRAAARPTALVAASTRGHRHVLHTVVGDTAARLVRLSPVPVLLVPPSCATRAATGAPLSAAIDLRPSPTPTAG